jgi:hypothetical protein
LVAFGSKCSIRHLRTLSAGRQREDCFDPFAARSWAAQNLSILSIDSIGFISNTGITDLKDDNIVDPKKLEPIHIAVVELN